MTEATTEKTIEPETTEADAVVFLKDTVGGIDLQVAEGEGATPNNRATHFAHWLGKNFQALVQLSRGDYERQLQEQKAARKLLEPARKLIGADGKPLQ